MRFRSRQKLSIRLFVLLAMMSSSLSAASHANMLSLPPGVTAKNSVKYRVTMRTKVVVPDTEKRCRQIRVWHAMPNTRPWSRTTRIPGIVSLGYQPTFGRLRPEPEDKNSAHVYFEDNQSFKPGQVCYYQTEFELYSSERTFEQGSRAVAWHHYKPQDFVGAARVKSVDPAIASLADQMKSRTNPISFVKEACVWIRENIKYDASVPYHASDAGQIMANKRGHCGHAQTVFLQLCARAGIPYKGMLGLNLHYPNGVGDLASVRADYDNAHTWGAVYFPSIGWIEVDSMEGEKCFFIDRQYVQNNAIFENYAVWVKEEGLPSRRVVWTPTNDGRFVCDYGVEHKITFTR